MTLILILFHGCAEKLKHNQKESSEAFLINTFNIEAERLLWANVCNITWLPLIAMFQEVKLMKSHRVLARQ